MKVGHIWGCSHLGRLSTATLLLLAADAAQQAACPMMHRATASVVPPNTVLQALSPRLSACCPPAAHAVLQSYQQARHSLLRTAFALTPLASKATHLVLSDGIFSHMWTGVTALSSGTVNYSSKTCI